MNSFQVVSIIIILLIALFLRLPSKLIAFILYKIKLFLPITKQDYLNSIQMMKTNKAADPRFKQVDLWVVRSCSIGEYLEGKASDTIKKLESYILLVIAVVTCNILSGLDYYFFGLYESTYQLSLSFAFLLVSYLVFLQISNLIKNKKEIYMFLTPFLSIFIVLSSIHFLNQKQYLNLPVVFNINYREICGVFNDRVTKISKVAITDFNQDSIADTMNFSCTTTKLNFIIIFLFSFFTASLFRSSSRRAYFDLEITKKTLNYQQIENIYRSNFSNNNSASNNSSAKNDKNKTDDDISNSFLYRNLVNLNKIKMILSIIIFGLLIDALSLNEIKEVLQITEIQYYFIVCGIILIESIFDIVCFRFHSSLLINNNYFETINFFQKTGNTFDDSIHFLYKAKTAFNIDVFWEIINGFVNYSLTPIIIIISIITQHYFSYLIELNENTNSNNDANNTAHYTTNTLKSGIFVTLNYFILLSFYFSKGVVTNIYCFYMYYSQNKVDKPSI